MHLVYVHCTHYLGTLSTDLEIFSGWVCSLSKTFNFPMNIKGITNWAILMRVEKELINFLRWGKFSSLLKTWNQFDVSVLFYLFHFEIINFLVWNNKKSKKKSCLLFDVTIMYCKNVTESFSGLWNQLLLTKTIIRENGQYVNIRDITPRLFLLVFIF